MIHDLLLIGSRSTSSLLSPVLQSPAPTLPVENNSSPNGHTYPSPENLATSPTKNPVQMSPTPKPRSKNPPRPVPRKQRAGTIKPTPSSYSGNDDRGSRENEERGVKMAANTLPAGAYLDTMNGTPPSSISPSPEMLTSSELSRITDGPSVPSGKYPDPNSDSLGKVPVTQSTTTGEGPQQPPLPLKDKGPPPFALPPERKYFSENSVSSGSMIPPLPSKEKPDGPPAPPAPYQRRMSSEKRATMADTRSRSGSPSKPLPYSSTLPANRALDGSRTSESPPRLPRQPRIASPPLPDKDPRFSSPPPPVAPPRNPVPPQDQVPSSTLLPDLPPKDPRFSSSPPPPAAPPRNPAPSQDQVPSSTLLPDLPPKDPRFSSPPPPAAPPKNPLPTHENQMPSPTVNTASDTMPPEEEPPNPPQTYSDSESDEDEGPERSQLVIRSLQQHRKSDAMFIAPQLLNEGGLEETSDFSGTSVEASPAHTSGTIRQQSTGSRQIDHDDDIIPLGGIEESMDPDYMNQDAVETHTSGTIRQQTTGSRQIDHEDDIIPLGGTQEEEEDPDYMNQDAIDEDLEDNMADMNSENDSEDERNCHAGGTRKIIVSQKSDRKGSIDMILGLPLMGGGREDDASDYMNQDAIDDMEEEKEMKDAPGSDYMNQAAVDNATANLEAEATKEDDDTNAWSAIEYMNQSIIDQVHEEIMKQEVENLDYINQDVIDSTFNVVGEPVYDTEDDLTEDELEGEEEGDNVRIHSYKEPLQIRGTFPVKSRTIKPDDDALDYMNQDVVEEVLEGDIIPMVVAGGSADLSMDITQSSWIKDADEPKTPSSGLKTQAEASDGDSQVMVSHDQITDNTPDETRASFCSEDSGASSLDFTCRRQTVGDGLAAGRKGNRPEQPKLKDAREIAQSLDVAIATKPRSKTDAKPLTDSRPPPLNLNSMGSYSSSSQDTPDGVDFQSQFSRDYIPVRHKKYSTAFLITSCVYVCVFSFSSLLPLQPVLPKSAGTFAGGDYGYHKPDFRKFKSTEDP